MAKLTEDDKINIVIKYEAGVKTSKIANEYGINVSGVKRIMHRYREYGIDGIAVKHTRRKFTEDFKCEVLSQVEKGESIDSIALIYNIEHSTINNWERKRNENKLKIVYNTSNEGISGTMVAKEVKDEDISKPLTDEERKELIELRKKNKQLEMENEILKKLKALVQQRMEQQKKKK